MHNSNTISITSSESELLPLVYLYFKTGQKHNSKTTEGHLMKLITLVAPKMALQESAVHNNQNSIFSTFELLPFVGGRPVCIRLSIRYEFYF